MPDLQNFQAKNNRHADEKEQQRRYVARQPMPIAVDQFRVAIGLTILRASITLDPPLTPIEYEKFGLAI
ncbi:MAG: hypothetical protein EpisKO_04880 [Epibacterium sp.]